ncbi:unnamed protein product [Meloidogyne enterolobii]|uniref:Uncharacterized protein n=1 Tax=Meloidogyne enterolobii TaxID=390850 RepID=A0ACB1A430_MELEN
MLLVVMQQQQSHQLILTKTPPSFIRPFIFSFIFIFTSIIWCSLQILQIEQQKGLNITNVNLIEEGENNFYPTAIKIFLYSIFILLTSFLCAYIGAISFGIFHISFKTVLSHWEIFKKELFMPAIENGQISVNLTVKPSL